MSEKQDAARLLGALGGKASARSMTPEQRVARGTAAARARWAKLLTTEEPSQQERQNQQETLK